MKFTAIQKQSTADLHKRANELRQEITDSRKSRILGDETDHNATNKLRKELARTLTALTQKEKQNA